jgi:hypothetical protein
LSDTGPSAADIATVESYYRGLKRQAYQEAGHAVIGSLLGRTVDLIEINVPENPEGNLGQVTFALPELSSQRELAIAVSGPIAQAQFEAAPLNWDNAMYAGDLRRIVGLLPNIERELGLSSRYFERLVDRVTRYLTNTRQWALIAALGDDLAYRGQEDDPRIVMGRLDYESIIMPRRLGDTVTQGLTP